MLDLQTAVTNGASRQLQGDVALLARAPREAVDEAAEGLKDDVRAEVRRGLDLRRGAGFIKSFVFDDGGGDAAALVVNTWVRRDGGDPLVPHTKGATIRSTRPGGFLVQPAPGATRRVDRLRRSLDRLDEDPKLQIIPQGPGRFVFIRRASKRRTVLLAFLSRQVRVPKSLDFAPLVARAAQDFEVLLNEKLGPIEEGGR